MSNSFILPIDRTLSGTTTPGLSRPGSNANEGVLCIPQSSSIRLFSVTFPGHLLGKFYSSVKMQLVCSTAHADYANIDLVWFLCLMAYQLL